MPKEKLIFILTILSLLYFIYALFKKSSPQSYLLGIIYLLPFMNFLATKEMMGGFKTFDIVSFGALLYLLKFFLAENVISKKYWHLGLFIALMIVAVTGSIMSEHPNSSLIDVLKILPAFILARFLLLECIQSPSFHYQIIKTLKLAFTLALLFLGIQLLVGISFTFYPSLNINTFDPLRGAVRYPGYFNDSQAQGQFFAAGSFLFLYNPQYLTKKEKLINYGLFLLCIAAVFLTSSRSAFLGFMVGLTVLLLLTASKHMIYIVVIAAFISVVYKYLPSKSGVLSRTENIDEDLKFRQSVWSDAFNISKKFPLVGIGSGNYQNYTKQHNPNQYFELDNEILYFDQPENGYLKVLVEFGFTGLLIFALIFLSPVINAIKKFLTGESDYKIVLLVAGILSWMVAFNSVYSLFDTRLLILITIILVLIISYPKTINNYSGEN